MFCYIAESIEELNDAESFQNEESFDPIELKEDSPMSMNADQEHVADENKEIVQNKFEEEKEENDSSDDMVKYSIFLSSKRNVQNIYVSKLLQEILLNTKNTFASIQTFLLSIQG